MSRARWSRKRRRVRVAAARLASRRRTNSFADAISLSWSFAPTVLPPQRGPRGGRWRPRYNASMRRVAEAFAAKRLHANLERHIQAKIDAALTAPRPQRFSDSLDDFIAWWRP